MRPEELCEIISEDLQNPIAPEDILGAEIKLSHLKKIDKVFEKGLAYYLDPKEPEISKEASIFFRKSTFRSPLNLGSRKVVNKFEQESNSIAAIASLSNQQFSRKLPVFNSHHDPAKTALQVRDNLYPGFFKVKRQFLESFIGKLANQNVLVFEFVETWNKKNKANIDGFFLKPNVIVLKRHQKYMRREIFTLAHELGHYLLNEEEVEEIETSSLSHPGQTDRTETWCNEFAFHFLAGRWGNIIDQLENAGPENDYHKEVIEEASSKTHISELAIYTRLLFRNKITYPVYQRIKGDIQAILAKREEEEALQRELEKSLGKTEERAPKPIRSPLLISTVQTAYYEGLLSEYEVCEKLGIKPDKLDQYLQ